MNKNQNGFATLEIILVIGIIAIFSTVAVPKMARILDKVALDYELKHLYSDLNFARSIGKSSTTNDAIFNSQILSDGSVGIYFHKRTDNYEIQRTNLSFKDYNHKLSNGIDLDYDSNLTFFTLSGVSYKTVSIDYPITFNNPSRYSNGSNTITLTSKFGYSAQIKFDSVGRWRGTYVK